MSVRTFRDLIVWQKAFALCLLVYRTTDTFPRHERFGLVAELRKTARSVMCNIAEGNRRKSRADYIRFLDIAYASLAELETQLLLADGLTYLETNAKTQLESQLREVDRMLPALMNALRNSASSS